VNQVAIRVIVAVALLAVATVTFAALRESDRWRRPGRSTSRSVDDPYDGLARLLAAGPAPPSAPVRDPFRPGDVRTGPLHTATVKVLPPAPAREVPKLTAIVTASDGEPQALISYQGHNYTVGAGALFADYKVVSVTADAVVLEHVGTGQQLILQRPKKGE
jgi:hypothetical protein